MKKLIFTVLATTFVMFSASANGGITPEEFQRLRNDPEFKRAIELSLDIFRKSGSMVLCAPPSDLGQTLALTFYGVPYKVTQLTSIAPTVTSTMANSGSVCVAISGN